MSKTNQKRPFSACGRDFPVPDIWKKAVLLFAGCLFGVIGFSQSYLPYDQGWLMIGESKDYVDVSARVMNCGGEDQVHLQFFNENPSSQEQELTIELAAEGQKTISKTYKVPLTPGEMIQSECGQEENYIIYLPRGYNPEKISADITFKSKSDK